ncbi:uncharacterized protein LOC126905471 isoform X2 [Daktulosphaira vitifoliae]|uniref:uncharacterized protein LOC126905471 isoform X2 n=1 Tax=Daktulosphaira vitifoliae TaxID=58002 RepID=UPI0021A97C79|nr:uncharacterized protein LOC126905471 isoform X2 [Daktulosphaira vitifoliae]
MATYIEDIPKVVVENLESNFNSDIKENEQGNNNTQLQQPYSTSRNKSPVTVQEWVDSIPTVPAKDEYDHIELYTPHTVVEIDNLTLGAEAGHLSRILPIPNVTITTENDVVHAPSEAGSQTSSFDSKILNARKPDPEEILLGLGFGGGIDSFNYGENGRVPKRFLQPSQLKGVSVEDYLKHQQELIYMYESGLWGYRGLTGPSHANPSMIVAKIMEKLKDHERGVNLPKITPNVIVSPVTQPLQMVNNNEKPIPNRFSKTAKNILTKIRCTPGSVLSPDNRKWLDNQGGDKSPEMSRRLIIGQQSFVFTREGALIESRPSNVVNDCENYSVISKKKDVMELSCPVINQCSDKLDNETPVLFKVGSITSINSVIQSSMNMLNKEYSPERDLEDLLSVVEPCQDVSKANSEVDSGAASEIADTLSSQKFESNERIDGQNNKAISLVTFENLKQLYGDLLNLRSKLNVLGCPFNIMPEDQFMNLSIEQRCALQCKILRLALRVYINQLTDDEVHYELKNCLGVVVQDIADLLDTNSDADKLAIIVHQMNALLHHQTHLNNQLVELTARAQNPIACHDMCELILQRVQGLEQLVEQNANDLALMKAHLLNKN